MLGESEQPNILLIMTDQLRYDWLGYAGNSNVHTPHIDSIARRGIRFTRAVCNSPLCAPSRASIASGCYPHRTGVMDNSVNYPIDQPTYYQQLRKAGYRVGVIGKTDLHKANHFYGENGDLPLMYELGFTDPLDTEGKMGAGMVGQDAQAKALIYEKDAPYNESLQEVDLVGPYQKHLYKQDTLAALVKDYHYRFHHAPVWYADQAPIPKNDYQDSYIGKKACQFIEQVSKDSPWHLFVSFVGPHDPWDAPQEYLRLFAETQFPEAIQDDMQDKPQWIKNRKDKHTGDVPPHQDNLVKQHYAGMITLIDEWVGKIVETLNDRGMMDNTVIIFSSDHGEMLGDHGLYEKYVMYEPSVRVPLFILDPRISVAGDSDELAELVDLYPTILDLAKGEYESNQVDGKSLLPLMHGSQIQHKEYQISELYNTRMIFDGKYKFIENWNDSNELYDLEEDPHELNNTIDVEPDVAKQLFLAVRRIRKQIG